MSRLKKMFGDMDVTKDLLLLLTIGGLYALAIALSNTFVNVYLWKQSGKFTDLAIYNLAIVVLQPITFLFAGRLAKKKIDRAFVLRFGVIFFSRFLFNCLNGRRTSGRTASFIGKCPWDRLWFLLACF
ncbi:hypothetical protein BsIDN1_43620 [Bacillus safensis]|uniref:Uncharacterized protein n=1 Tax=Bacillus safensis TaxID=561879 RepID=A0A5S9MF29_BACIA|nr:hypothetical protein BsIDN1_43620 [Bacillus safensis]